jgi:hypothetical protein
VRSPEELDTIDWQSLYHAYGDGTDVPDRIRALYGDDADRADTALSELFNHVLHQGTVYPATVAAVPFFAHAAVHAPHGRADVLALLAGAGGEGPVPWAGDQEEGHAPCCTCSATTTRRCVAMRCASPAARARRPCRRRHANWR